MARKKPVERHHIEVKVGDEMLRASYTVTGGIVEVIGPDGRSRGTQQGNSSAEEVARRVIHLMYASFSKPGRA